MRPATLARSRSEAVVARLRRFAASLWEPVTALSIPMVRRKLYADARYLARHAFSLLVLIGLGVMLFVALYEGYQHLTLTYDTIYERGRMADASVLVERAPEGLVQQARTIPGVRAAMGRVVKDGSIIQRGRERERVTGRFVGVPRGRRPRINDLWIIEGRYIANADEAVLEHQFAGETGYHVGDTIKCAYLGREREFSIVGLALSPEYVYPVPSKLAMWISRGTFGVVFIAEDRAREWLGTGRQITEIHADTLPGYEAEVLGKLEALSKMYGVETSYVQDDQPSKHLLTLDQQGFATLSVFFPILFLTAAGLSLYGALARIVRLQVTIIGTLKACGFGSGQIMVQYMLQGALVGLGGAIPGVIIGHFLSVWIGHSYLNQLHLPVIFTSPHWETLSTGLILAVGTGLAASWLPARMAARMPPAVAMRGEVISPASINLQRRLAQWVRLKTVSYLIPLRGVLSRASRTILAVAGISGGAIIIITTLGMYVSTMDAINEYIVDSRHYEIDLQFTAPEGMDLVHAVAGLPSGKAVCLTTTVPVRMRSSWAGGELLLTGIERGQQLFKVRTFDDRPFVVEPGKVWVPKQIAAKLRVEAGDPVRVEWIQSSRRHSVWRSMRVAGILDVSFGNSAYGEFHDIRRAFSDKLFPYSSYGAFLACSPGRVEAIKRRLERSDLVGLAFTTSDVRKQVDEQMGLMYIFIALLLGFGGVLAGSVIHSVGSVSILERTRELATLRSLGFTARAASGLLGTELYILAALGLIVGCPAGAVLNEAYMASFTTENMSFRAILPPWVFIVTAAILFGLVALSARTATRRLAALDLSQATKARE